MSETIRVTNRMRRCIDAFKEKYDGKWLRDLNDPDAISLMLCDWVRKNYDEKAAEEILKI